jgi:hypothetical protein
LCKHLPLPHTYDLPPYNTYNLPYNTYDLQYNIQYELSMFFPVITDRNGVKADFETSDNAPPKVKPNATALYV